MVRLFWISNLISLNLMYLKHIKMDEIISYAQKSGMKRIGIAYCISLQKEAKKLKLRLAEQFEVYSIDCKYGKIPSGELLGTESKMLSCNPAGQAEYLAQNYTELNISFGLCLGHDNIFSQKSKAPVTTLVVKDRKYKNNPYKEFEVKNEIIYDNKTLEL